MSINLVDINFAVILHPVYQDLVQLLCDGSANHQHMSAFQFIRTAYSAPLNAPGIYCCCACCC